MYRYLTFLVGTATIAFIGSAPAARAQAPGEDPLVLNKAVSVQMQIGNAAPSGNLDGNTEMPAWLRARVARYEAQAFSANTTGIATDNDAVTTANAQGLKKTCVQEVGSVTSAAPTPGSKYGTAKAPQVVVLRGDLVNICN